MGCCGSKSTSPSIEAQSKGTANKTSEPTPPPRTPATKPRLKDRSSRTSIPPPSQSLVTRNQRLNAPTSGSASTSNYSPPTAQVSSTSAPPVTEAPKARPTSDILAQPDVSRSLWAQAYDKVATDKPKLIEAFEGILLQIDLDSDSLELRGQDLRHNEHDQDRHELLNAVVECGLRKTEAWAEGLERAGKISTTLAQVGKIIQSMLLASLPQAGAAWLGISILLKGLTNASEQSSKNREGIVYVGSRAGWYQALFSISDNPQQGDLLPIRQQLEEKIVNLFVTIIKYQMRSVCEYYRNQVAVALHNSVAIRTWEIELGEVKDSEDQVVVCLEQYDRRVLQDHLSSLMATALQLELKTTEWFKISEALHAEQIERERRKAEDEKKRMQDEDQKRAAKLIGKFRLGGLNYDEFMDSNPDPIEGTCQWFFNDERVMRWKSGSQKLLLVTAMPGQGKSVLARSLVHLWREERRNNVCHFFFKDTNKIQKSTTMALCAILHQILRQSPFLALKAERIITQEGEGLTESMESLWRVLEEVISHTRPETAPVLCVLDALDESDYEACQKLLRKIVVYCRKGMAQSMPKLKFILTARPLDRITQSLTGVSKVSLDPSEKGDAISSEIELVIETRVKEMAPGKFWSDGLRLRIREVFREKGTQFTYLWLKLVFDLLEDERALSDDEEWIRIITKLPPTVNEAYETLLGQIKPNTERHVRELLSIMLCVERPLEVEEMNVALMAALSNTRAVNRTYMKNTDGFKTWINSHCGFFVQIYKNKLQLIHQTAKEFLTAANERSSHERKWQGSFRMDEAHKSLRDLCCRYLADRTSYWKSEEWKDSRAYPNWLYHGDETLGPLDRFIPYAISGRGYHNEHCGHMKVDNKFLGDVIYDATFKSPIATIRMHREAFMSRSLQEYERQARMGSGSLATNLWLQKYAYDCLETLKRCWADQEKYSVDQSPDFRGQSKEAALTRRGSPLAAHHEPQEKSKDFLQDLLYPMGDSTKKARIQVARIYFASITDSDLGNDGWFLSEHVEGEDLLSIVNKGSSMARDICLRRFSEMIALFFCFPVPGEELQVKRTGHFGSRERQWHQAEAVLRKALNQSVPLQELTEHISKEFRMVRQSGKSVRTSPRLRFTFGKALPTQFAFSSDGTLTIVAFDSFVESGFRCPSLIREDLVAVGKVLNWLALESEVNSLYPGIVN